MKFIFKRTVFFFLFFVVYNVNAQESDVELLVDDMLKIAGDFAYPASVGAAYQSSSGWFVSAKSLEKWEFEFSVHANVLFIPEKKKSNVVLSDDYTTFDIRGAESATIPTAFGGDTDVVFEGEIEFGVDKNGNPIIIPFAFQALEGVKKDIVAHPFVQGTIGLPLGTNFSVRYLPKIKVDGVQFSTYGFGLKHNFNQYFNSYPTDFQFAALLAYSRFDVDYDYPPVIIDMVAELNSIEIDADLWLFQLITSKSFYNSNWEIFGAVGLTNSDFGYVLGGSGPALPKINMELETLNKNEMEVKGDLGFNYKFGKFIVSSMFSIGKYFNYNLGLHFRI